METQAFRIAVASDFSTCSERAVSLALSVAHDKLDGSLPVQVYLLHIIESVVPNYDEELGVLEPETMKANLEALAASRKSGVHVEAIIKRGTAADEILRFAKKKGIDLLVLGTHGRTGLRHALLGSVAERVVREAECPVMTVKEPSNND